MCGCWRPRSRQPQPGDGGPVAVITITGMSGSGATEIGAEVARLTGFNYVDRLILAEAAQRIGATVEAVATKTEKTPTLADRFGSFLRTLMERSAMESGGGDPYYGPGLDTLLTEYRDLPDPIITSGYDINDAKLLEVTRSVIEELAHKDNVVIIGRGANIILGQWPRTLHVGLVTSLEKRLERLKIREGLEGKEAEKHIAENDRARAAYFQRFFKVQSLDPLQYHLMLNTDRLDVPQAAEAIVQLGSQFEER